MEVIRRQTRLRNGWAIEMISSDWRVQRRGVIAGKEDKEPEDMNK